MARINRHEREAVTLGCTYIYYTSYEIFHKFFPEAHRRLSNNFIVSGKSLKKHFNKYREILSKKCPVALHSCNLWSVSVCLPEKWEWPEHHKFS